MKQLVSFERTPIIIVDAGARAQIRFYASVAAGYEVLPVSTRECCQ